MIDTLPSVLVVERGALPPLLLIGGTDTVEVCALVAGIVSGLERRCADGTAVKFGPLAYKLLHGERL